MRIIGNDPSVPRQTQEVASGTLPNGRPVVVNSDGTVSSVSQTTNSESLGAEVQFNGQNSVYSTACFDSAAGKCVVFYRDSGASNAGKYIVGTISGQSITYGSEDFFASASRTQYNSAVFEPVAGKVVIAYQDQDGSFYGKVRVGTLSGTSITWGTPVTFNSNETTYIEAVYHTGEGKIVVAYKNSSNYARAIAGTVSGNSITFGTGVDVDPSGGTYMPAVYTPAAQKVVTAFRATSSIGCCRVLTLSGTTITVGARQSFITTGQANQGAIAYDTTSETVVIAFRDEANTTYGSIVAGSVSGDTITYGSLLTFQSGSIDWLGIRGFASGGGVILAYDNNSSSPTYVPVKYFTISGTTITLVSTVTFYSGGGVGNRSYGFAEDTANDKMLLAFNADGIGRSKVYNPTFSATTLTSENYIGMSSGTAFQTGSAASVGSAAVFESAAIGKTAATFDSSNNRIVISYRDSGNSNYATAVVGTVSGSSISFGTPVVFRSATVDNEAHITFDSNSNKIIAAYSHNALGKCKVLTVDPSDNSISVGSEATFDTQQGTNLGITFDSNSNKVVVVYTGANNYVESKVGTVSGTSISFGTAVVAKSSSTDGNAITFDSNRNKIVIVSRISTNAQAMVGTVSGTSISFASSVALGTQTKHLALTFDSSNNKVITAFVDGSDADQGKVIVGDIDSSGVISFGTAVQYNAEIEEQQGVAFDSNLNKVVIAYDSKGTSKGQVISGTVSGTSITFDSETVFEAADVEGVSVAFDSNVNKSVIAYEDVGNSQYGTGIVFTPTTIATTRGQVADGGHALIDTQGAISDNQIGLTAGQSYFVQTDGTIGTTAADPSVFAGTAVSATKLIVKG